MKGDPFAFLRAEAYYLLGAAEMPFGRAQGASRADNESIRIPSRSSRWQPLNLSGVGRENSTTRGTTVFQPGPYFMTEENQDAVIGRTVTRLQSARRERAALIAEAMKIGNELKGVGNLLSEVAQVPAFSDGSGPVRHDPLGKPDLNFRPYADVEIVNTLLGQLRAVSDEIRKIRSTLKEAGIVL